MMYDGVIKEVFMEVLGVDGKDVRVRGRLMGGMSNYMYLVGVNGVLYTFRVPSRGGDKFVDRVVERYHVGFVEGLGVGNETVFFDVKRGYKIARYVEGKVLSEVDSLDYLGEVSEILHRVHAMGLSSYDYDPLGRLLRYEGYVRDCGYEDSERYGVLRRAFMGMKDMYFQRSRYRFCHGDAQSSNFVVSEGGKLLLVDWEFGGNNDPFYDVACFGNRDFAHALELLGEYLGRVPRRGEYNRLYFLRAFQCLQWYNVALYKDFIGLSSEFGVDFMLLAKRMLDRVEVCFDGIR